MKHSTEDLLLAAKVLTIAAGMAAQRRREEWDAWRKGLPARPSQEEGDAKHRELERTHTSNAHLGAALTRLESVAQAIKTRRL